MFRDKIVKRKEKFFEIPKGTLSHSDFASFTNPNFFSSRGRSFFGYDIHNTEIHDFGGFDRSVYEILDEIGHDKSISKLKQINYRYKDGYHYIDKTVAEADNSPNLYEYDVEYKLNKYFFRSDNFKKEHDGIHILFAGCSESFGEGGNIEDNWTHKVYKEIEKNNKVSGYFNLSVSGGSWEAILRNIICYINKFGKPDYLFMLMPNILRFHKWDKDQGGWQFVSRNYILDSEIDEDRDLYLSVFPYWTLLLQIFLEYCKLNGIRIVWSTWYVPEQTNISELKFLDNTFINIPEPGVTEETLKEYEDDIKNDLNFFDRRDGHRGNFFHNHVSNLFLNKIKSEGYFKL